MRCAGGFEQSAILFGESVKLARKISLPSTCANWVRAANVGLLTILFKMSTKDLVDCWTEVLLNPAKHKGKCYTLTGPSTFSLSSLAGLITKSSSHLSLHS